MQDSKEKRDSPASDDNIKSHLAETPCKTLVQDKVRELVNWFYRFLHPFNGHKYAYIVLSWVSFPAVGVKTLRTLKEKNLICSTKPNLAENYSTSVINIGERNDPVVQQEPCVLQWPQVHSVTSLRKQAGFSASDKVFSL